MTQVVRRIRQPHGAPGQPPFASVRDLVATLRPEMPVYALYPGRIARAAQSFLTSFPGTTLYAVKANPALPVLDALHAAGIRHFDTASMGEVALIRSRYPDAQCYFMAPIRPRGDAGRAYRMGVTHFSLDDAREIATVLGETAAAGCRDPGELTLYVRLSVPSDGAALELSSKFGVGPEAGAELLTQVAATGARPALTFHVGSLCLDPQSYARALRLCGEVLERSGVRIAALDVGGGFPAPYPGTAVPPMAEYFAAIARMRTALGLAPDLPLLAEPGRALVAEGLALVAQVMLRRAGDVFLNDGLFGSLNELSLPGWDVSYPITAYGAGTGGTLVTRAGAPRKFRAWGPTCDTLDKLPRPLALPEDVADGDWLVFEMLGAYSCAMRTAFNGFYPDTFHEVLGG